MQTKSLKYSVLNILQIYISHFSTKLQRNPFTRAKEKNKTQELNTTNRNAKPHLKLYPALPVEDHKYTQGLKEKSANMLRHLSPTHLLLSVRLLPASV